MSKGPFDSLNIYYPYGLLKLGFKNTTGNRPFFYHENFYLGHNIWWNNIWCNNIWWNNIWSKNFLVGLSFTGRDFFCILFVWWTLSGGVLQKKSLYFSISSPILFLGYPQLFFPGISLGLIFQRIFQLLYVAI